MLLVTGGTGFIGGHLLENLCASGVSVRALVRPTAIPRRLPAGVDAVAGDLSSGQGLDAALAGVDTVIHLAGVTKALRPADYRSGNVLATGVLARAVSGRKIRFVHVSSLAAAGPSPDAAHLTEECVENPVSQYGRSKWEAEKLVRELLPDAVIVRPPVVYGPRDTDVFQMLKSISRGMVVQIAGGERWFSAIYVEDLITGLLAAAHAPKAPGRTYFLAYPKPASWSELAATAARIMSIRTRVLRVPLAAAKVVGLCAERWSSFTGKPGILSRDKVLEAQYSAWTCDPRRASSELGFDARTSLDAGLARTLAWYKEAGWLSY